MKTLVKPVTVVAVATLLSVGSTKLDLSSISTNKNSFASNKTAVSKEDISTNLVSKASDEINSARTNYKLASVTKKTVKSFSMENISTESVAEKIRFTPAAINDLNLIEPVAEAETMQSLIKFEIPEVETSIVEPTTVNAVLESTTANYLDDLLKFKAPILTDSEIASTIAEVEFLELVKFKVPTIEESNIMEPVQLDELVKFKAPSLDESIIEEPVIENPNCLRASN